MAVWYTLQQRGADFAVCMVQRIVTGRVKLDLAALMFVSLVTLGTRNKIASDRAKTSQRAIFFINRAGSKYLKLTKNIGFLPNFGCFKRNVSNFLLKP